MSFLFTFRLPRLPFPNPFATAAAEQADASQNLAIGSNKNVHLCVPDASRVSRVNAPSSSGFQRSREEEVTNSRKRNRTSLNDNRYTIPTQNAYQDNLHNTPFEASRTRTTMPNMRGEYEYDSEAGGDEERPGKRRKVGIAETILSTAVSVAIVSTAVGYTAYRLWRDGGSTPGVNTNDDETEALDLKKESAVDWENGQARDGRNNHNISGIASPPPPYYASYEDSWAGYGDGRPRAQSGRGETSTSIGRTGGRYSSSQQDYPAVRPGTKRGPMAKVHRTLKTSSSPRSGGRQIGHQYEEEGVYGRRKGSGVEQNERLASPTGQKPDGWRSVHRHANVNTAGRRRETKHVAVVRSDSEGYEEGSSRLEEQMDWMSERLRGLIADGKKALEREIVVAEGVADSLHGNSDGDGTTGHLDDGEGGWEDAEDYQINLTPSTLVVRHPGGSVSTTRESPRKLTESAFAARLDEPHTLRDKALTARQLSGS